MISVIICSISKTLLNQVSKNIEETIGLPFEIVAIDNIEAKYGICEAYNFGAKQSKYDYLCFIHEDLLFRTNNWGINLMNHFQDNQTGAIGVAGGVVKSNFHSSWWYSLRAPITQRKNLIQSSKEGPKLDYLNPFNEKVSEVLFLDGLFIACKKEIWAKNPFDSINFPGFHFYDLDFSFSLNQKSKVIVVYDILLEHLSLGAYNKGWIVAAEKFTEKWKILSTISLIPLTKLEEIELEIDAIRFYRDACFKQKQIKKAFKAIWKLIKVSNAKSGLKRKRQ